MRFVAVAVLASLPAIACLPVQRPATAPEGLAEPLEVSFQGNRSLRIKDYMEANSTLRQVYKALPERTLYCGCPFDPMRKRAPIQGCSYSSGDDQDTYYKVHWEHVVPAARLGRNRQCWIGHPCKRKDGKPYGGRSCCRKIDPMFRAMEADMHNLRPAIGDINIRRQDYSFGEIPGEKREFGRCDMEISSETDTAEPAPEIRGIIARTYLYMNDAYELQLRPEEIRLFLTWHRKYPPNSLERERDTLIRKLQGNSNPYIHGYGLDR